MNRDRWLLIKGFIAGFLAAKKATLFNVDEYHIEAKQLAEEWLNNIMAGDTDTTEAILSKMADYVAEIDL